MYTFSLPPQQQPLAWACNSAQIQPNLSSLPPPNLPLSTMASFARLVQSPPSLPSLSLSLINTIFLRGMNDVNLNLTFVLQIACTVVDYKYSLHGLPLDSDDYLRVLSEVFFSFFKSLSLSLCLVSEKWLELKIHI